MKARFSFEKLKFKENNGVDPCQNVSRKFKKDSTSKQINRLDQCVHFWRGVLFTGEIVHASSNSRRIRRRIWIQDSKFFQSRRRHRECAIGAKLARGIWVKSTTWPSFHRRQLGIWHRQAFATKISNSPLPASSTRTNSHSRVHGYT